MVSVPLGAVLLIVTPLGANAARVSAPVVALIVVPAMSATLLPAVALPIVPAPLIDPAVAVTVVCADPLSMFWLTVALPASVSEIALFVVLMPTVAPTVVTSSVPEGAVLLIVTPPGAEAAILSAAVTTFTVVPAIS